MVALATANGKVKWTVETGGAGLATPVSSPLVSSNTVYFSGWDGTANTLYSVNETSGTINWTRELSTNELWGTPALSSADVYLGDYSGTMYAVRRSNGKIDWHHAVGGHPVAEPAVVNGSVYLTTGQDPNGTWSLSQTTGSKNWAADFDGQTSPAVQGVQVILSEFANVGVGAASLASGTGVPSWSITTGNGSSFSQTSPAVADGVVYLVGAYELWAIDEATGAVLWESNQYGDGQNVFGSPIVANGQVIAAAETTLTRQPCITAFGLL
jgi:eukaryotic-like serine/threonine-protein kinase